MIVIATHGMSGWRRIAFGSVAQKVVEQAPLPGSSRPRKGRRPFR
jgi:nucleotide-binding universal stress UspA family protein